MSEQRDGSAETGLNSLRTGSESGEIAENTRFAPGIALHADPDLGVGGAWRSPAGRLLELEVATQGSGQWIGLHIRLAPEAAGIAFVGFACRSAAPREIMVRPCLRSATGDGFADHFFPRHILAVPEALTHVDALHLPTTSAVPETAPWRELVLFLPRESFTWHLHDLRLFAE